MNIRTVFIAFLMTLGGASGGAQTYFDGIRICWDYRAQQYLGGGVYSRLKLLSDGTLACAYSAGSDVFLRLCRQGQWDSPIKVASDPSGRHNYTNSELLELADGRLMYAWNARARRAGQPYKIMVAYSADKGRSWSGEETLYTAGTEWTDGCWEPAMMQLPDGEVQLFFANEHNIPDNRQNITMLRSTDGCVSWEDPMVVSFRSTSRDGMPVPLCLQNGRDLVLAIEDNGLNGNFKPVIIHSSVADNWRGGTVTGSSPHRWSALATTDELAPSVYAGAPYLIQLHSGQTLLSCQSSEGRKSADYPIMQTYVGNSQAKNFCCRSTPFPFVGEEETQVQWCALAQTGDSTVMATSSVSNRKSQNGIWNATGHIYHPMKVLRTQGGVTDWVAIPAGLFIGSESQAQTFIRSAWDTDSLYVHFQVLDQTVVRASEGSAAWDSDGIELYIDRNKRGGEKVMLGMYKLLVNVKGEVQAETATSGSWRSWTNTARYELSPTDSGYEVLVALPWRDIGGIPSRKDMTVFFRLHNNDNGGIVCHENMSGGNPDRPLTWMRCSLSDETVSGITAIPYRPTRLKGADESAAYTLGGRRMSPAEEALGKEIYVTRGRKVLP